MKEGICQYQIFKTVVPPQNLTDWKLLFELGRLECNAIQAAELLKAFLKDLPEPLFPFASYQKFFEAATKLKSQKEKDLQYMELFDAELPIENQQMARVIFGVLMCIASNRDVTYMTPSSLGLIFGPLLLRSKVGYGIDTPQLAAIGKSLIELYGTPILEQYRVVKQRLDAENTVTKNADEIIHTPVWSPKPFVYPVDPDATDPESDPAPVFTMTSPPLQDNAELNGLMQSLKEQSEGQVKHAVRARNILPNRQGQERAIEFTARQREQFQGILKFLKEILPEMDEELIKMQQFSKTVKTLEGARFLAQRVWMIKALVFEKKDVSGMAGMASAAEEFESPFEIQPPPLTPGEHRELLLTKKVIFGSAQQVRDEMPKLVNWVAGMSQPSEVDQSIRLIMKLMRMFVF
eukprot:TRINITY_DN10237_c0_g2_i1.p1 TRINITY_DN10237_c0_g2~~TRINITY_DN10237_c0_g2_i1.p1  ORF type:complete len:458 (+),score=107.70 TRINITY_DN10237_c0_g2_i1:158-1375(+)